MSNQDNNSSYGILATHKMYLHKLFGVNTIGSAGTGYHSEGPGSTMLNNENEDAQNLLINTRTNSSNQLSFTHVSNGNSIPIITCNSSSTNILKSLNNNPSNTVLMNDSLSQTNDEFVSFQDLAISLENDHTTIDITGKLDLPSNANLNAPIETGSLVANSVTCRSDFNPGSATLDSVSAGNIDITETAQSGDLELRGAAISSLTVGRSTTFRDTLSVQRSLTCGHKIRTQDITTTSDAYFNSLVEINDVYISNSNGASVISIVQSDTETKINDINVIINSNVICQSNCVVSFKNTTINSMGVTGNVTGTTVSVNSSATLSDTISLMNTLSCFSNNVIFNNSVDAADVYVSSGDVGTSIITTDSATTTGVVTTNLSTSSLNFSNVVNNNSLLQHTLFFNSEGNHLGENSHFLTITNSMRCYGSNTNYRFEVRNATSTFNSLELTSTLANSGLCTIHSNMYLNANNKINIDGDIVMNSNNNINIDGNSMNVNSDGMWILSGNNSVQISENQIVYSVNRSIAMDTNKVLLSQNMETNSVYSNSVIVNNFNSTYISGLDFNNLPINQTTGNVNVNTNDCSIFQNRINQNSINLSQTTMEDSVAISGGTTMENSVTIKSDLTATKYTFTALRTDRCEFSNLSNVNGDADVSSGNTDGTRVSTLGTADIDYNGNATSSYICSSQTSNSVTCDSILNTGSMNVLSKSLNVHNYSLVYNNADTMSLNNFVTLNGSDTQITASDSIEVNNCTLTSDRTNISSINSANINISSSQTFTTTSTYKHNGIFDMNTETTTVKTSNQIKFRDDQLTMDNTSTNISSYVATNSMDITNTNNMNISETMNITNSLATLSSMSCNSLTTNTFTAAQAQTVTIGGTTTFNSLTSGDLYIGYNTNDLTNASSSVTFTIEANSFVIGNSISSTDIQTENVLIGDAIFVFNSLSDSEWANSNSNKVGISLNGVDGFVYKKYDNSPTGNGIFEPHADLVMDQGRAFTLHTNCASNTYLNWNISLSNSHEGATTSNDTDVLEFRYGSSVKFKLLPTTNAIFNQIPFISGSWQAP